MRESARFLLAYATHDGKGMLHTFPSNAHETNWDVHDPTTDISAMRVLFPEVIEAATLLKTDGELVSQLKRELAVLPALPIVTVSSPKVLTALDADSADSIIGASYDPAAEVHNSENVGLEPVWPYGIIGDDGPRHLLGVRTYLNRPNKDGNDWSPEPVQAARLGLANEFKSSLLALTERYQVYPSGLAGFAGTEFYVEQIGVVADALENALVQDYDGLIRIAPAWPKDWDVDGTVYVRHQGKVHIQIRQGNVVTIGIQNGAKGTIRLRNPWPGRSVDVVDARSLTVVKPGNSQAILEFPARASTSYILQQTHGANNRLPFEMVSSTKTTYPKALGSRTIGIAR